MNECSYGKYRNITIKIINSYYQSDHLFEFVSQYRGYDASYGFDFTCSKCNYTIEFFFWEEDDWTNDDNLRFYSENYPDIDGTIINYFGESRILNDDKVEIITCNEWMIKKLIE